MFVTKESLRAATTSKGGYSQCQIKLAQSYTGNRSWKKELIGLNVTDEFWAKFVSLGSKTKREAFSKKPINAVSLADGWSWKPENTDVPKLKIKENPKASKRKVKKKLISRLDNDKFYISPEWRSLRARVLEKYECKCMMCGRSPKIHKIIIHVDHIRPRSKHPELSLEISNLQILCEDCNIGKSNRYDTDWRPESSLHESSELDLVMSAMERI